MTQGKQVTNTTLKGGPAGVAQRVHHSTQRPPGVRLLEARPGCGDQRQNNQWSSRQQFTSTPQLRLSGQRHPGRALTGWWHKRPTPSQTKNGNKKIDCLSLEVVQDPSTRGGGGKENNNNGQYSRATLALSLSPMPSAWTVKNGQCM